MQNFDVCFNISLNKLMNNQLGCQRFDKTFINLSFEPWQGTGYLFENVICKMEANFSLGLKVLRYASSESGEWMSTHIEIIIDDVIQLTSTWDLH